jgi:CrcB protein
MQALKNILLVGMGGFVGSALRYLGSGWAQSWMKSAVFPVGTATVNILGCLAIGLLGGLAENTQMFSPQLRLFVFLGLLGGFTTFSTFGYETMALVRDGELLLAFANVAFQLIFGVAAVLIGSNTTKFF